MAGALVEALFPKVPADFPNPNAKLVPAAVQTRKDKSIVIVGGGPAGVHMSACLAAQGYTKVTLLEAEPEVGGKSFTTYDPLQPDVPHEMGTCYMSPGYDTVRSLLKEYDPDNLESDFANEPRGRVVFGAVIDDATKRDFTKGLGYNEWVQEEAERVTTPGCCRCLPNRLQVAPIFVAMQKYVDLHQEIFGKYPYGLPPKPKNWNMINMTAREWMIKNGLQVLEPLFIYIQQAQGYGILDQIPAFYMLWWFHPDVANGTLQAAVKSDEYPVSLLKKGWQSLWLKMKERHSSQVKYITGAAVTEITRSPHVKVTYTQNGQTKTVEADLLISAVNLYRQRSLIKDLHKDEEAIFSKLKESTICTTLYKGKTTSHEHTVEFWFGRQLQPSKLGVGQFYAHRNSRMAARPEIPAKDSVELRVAYQFMDRPMQAGDEKKLADTLVEDLKTYAGEPAVDILLQKPWPYFPRFDSRGLVEGLPWKILQNLQGQRNTIFIGSSVCFESALDCVAYNRLLLDKMIV